MKLLAYQIVLQFDTPATDVISQDALRVENGWRCMNNFAVEYLPLEIQNQRFDPPNSWKFSFWTYLDKCEVIGEAIPGLWLPGAGS